MQDNWKNPSWLPIRYVYALHQIWSSVKWRFVTIFFVRLSKPYQAERGQMNGFYFFLSRSGAVYIARIRPREGSYSNFLTPAVSENVWCIGRNRHTKKSMVCLWCLLLFYRCVFTDACPLNLLVPQNSVLQLHKMMSPEAVFASAECYVP